MPELNDKCKCHHAYREHGKFVCLMAGCWCKKFDALPPPEPEETPGEPTV